MPETDRPRAIVSDVPGAARPGGPGRAGRRAPRRRRPRAACSRSRCRAVTREATGRRTRARCPAFSTLPGVTASSMIRDASSAARPGCSVPPVTLMSPATVPLPPSVPPVTSIGLALRAVDRQLAGVHRALAVPRVGAGQEQRAVAALGQAALVHARVARRLAARADRVVGLVDVARVRRQAVGPALGDLGRLPGGRLGGVLLLARPRSRRRRCCSTTRRCRPAVLRFVGPSSWPGPLNASRRLTVFQPLRSPGPAPSGRASGSDAACCVLMVSFWRPVVNIVYSACSLVMYGKRCMTSVSAAAECGPAIEVPEELP